MKKYLILFLYFTALTAFSQEKKNTLFFNYDAEYFVEKGYAPGFLYPKDFQTDEGSIFFSKTGDHNNLIPTKILSLKEYLLSLKIRKNRFTDLMNHLRQFKLFLVKEEKGQTKYIEIITGMEIY